MESLVMVACTVTLTVVYPMTEMTALAFATTVSDAINVARNRNNTRKLDDHAADYNNRETVETADVVIHSTFLDDGKTLKIGEKTVLPQHTELTTLHPIDKLNDSAESRGLKRGRSSRSELNLGQVNATGVTHQDLVPMRFNETYVSGVNLERDARQDTEIISLPSVKRDEEDLDVSNGSPAIVGHTTAAVLNLESVQSLNIEQQKETEEEPSGQSEATSGVDLEDLINSAAIFPDYPSAEGDGSLDTMTNSGQTEGNGYDLKVLDKEVELNAVYWNLSTKESTEDDLEINQTQPEANYTEPDVENFTFNDTETMFSFETTPRMEIDQRINSQEQSNSDSSIQSGSEDSSSSSSSVISTFKFPVSNETIYERLKSLVSALEQLGVLDPVGQCYMVERITKSVAGSAALLRIELFLETRSQSSTSIHHEDVDNNEAPGPGNETDLLSEEDSGEEVEEEEDCSVNGTSIRGSKCIPLMETDPGNWTDDDDGTLNGTDDWSPVNGTRLSRKSATQFNTESLLDIGALKPSRTQILVISTCSTVIGLFFIVALIMRIRNYLKRTRSLNKHRNGLRPHSRQHIASALTNDPTALALPPRTPPIDCAARKEVVVKQKNEIPFHCRAGSRPFFFAASRSSSSGSSSKEHNNSCSSSSNGRPASTVVVPTKMPQLRRQSDLSRLFISQRSQRETAKEYIRQLSLSQATPSNAVFLGGGTSFLDEAQSPPHDASRKLLPLSSETFHRLDMA